MVAERLKAVGGTSLEIEAVSSCSKICCGAGKASLRQVREADQAALEVA
jgi:hypothetical protein